MEMEPMTMVVAEKESLASLLRSLRGEIVTARLGYPEVLHLNIRDSAGDHWHLATQDAEWSPVDPDGLVGQVIESAEVDEESQQLHCYLGNGTVFSVKPARQEAPDDPCNWELLSPGGVILEYGPGPRWHIGDADVPPMGRRTSN